MRLKRIQFLRELTLRWIYSKRHHYSRIVGKEPSQIEMEEFIGAEEE